MLSPVGSRGVSKELLFHDLLDDAAMFPPGNADATTALTRHLGYRSGFMDAFVGPLLVHVDRWQDVVAAHAAIGSPPLEVVVIGGTEVHGAVPGLHVVGFELPAHGLPLPQVAPGLGVACELRADETGLSLLGAIADAPGHVGKFRTGGTTPDAFPDEPTLARVVVAAALADAPMKYTAGLHHAVRFRDEESGFEHHGFLNLLAATHAALLGGTEAEVAKLLGQRDGAVLAETVRSWSAQDVAGVRRAFVSFGCCGVEDPVRDLADLGLVDVEKESR
ncbi:MAG TPA: hypothetical protein VH419_17785 [Nocardioidaceae bacterium]